MQLTWLIATCSNLFVNVASDPELLKFSCVSVHCGVRDDLLLLMSKQSDQTKFSGNHF